MGRRSDPRWRDEAAATVAGTWIAREASGVRSALVMEDLRVEVAEALVRLGASVTRWGRRLGRGDRIGVWPQPGPFDLVTLRLPRSKLELEMAAHQAVSVLEPGGSMLVYGARDEGIGSVPARISSVLGEGSVVAAGARCRVLRFDPPPPESAERLDLDAWATTVADYPDELGEPPITFPGVFAGDRLDSGTALLLAVVGSPEPGASVLDFGCGWGVIGAVLAARQSELKLTLLDADAVALEAARRNVPQARRVLGQGLGAVEGRFDWIISNPPFHQGKSESQEVVRALVTGARDRLSARGRVSLVVQRRLPVGPMLRNAFGGATVLAEGTVHRVWEARR